MDLIDLSIFQGEIPRVSDKLLPVENASEASNCRLESGRLEPISGVSVVEAGVGSSIQTIYKMAAQFLRWSSPVNVVKSLVADSGNRVFYTGDSYPKDTNGALALASSPYPAASRRLGIPAPTGALAITLTGTAGADVEKSSSWVYTIVGKWADGSEVESAPSPPTAVVDIYSGITPRLTGFTAPTATGAYATHFRIYRLMAGTVGAEYQYVDEITTATTQFDDTVSDDDLGEVIPSTLWDAPADALDGIIATSHGMVAGFKGNTIYPSEIYIPYAFPSSYTLVTESDIVGLGYTGSMIMALTKTVPYLLTGQDPATISLNRLGYQQPCIASKSIVNVPGGVVYASPDGLFMINESGVGALITRDVFTKSQWKSLGPANLIGFYYDDAYYGFFSGTVNGFRFNLGSGDYQPIEMPEKIYGGHYSPDDDLLYLIQENGATRDIVSWDTGALMDYAWTSKTFSFSGQKIYTAAMVQGDFSQGDVTLDFLVDGVSVGAKTISSDGEFRIKPKRGNDFEVKLTGKATIDRVVIAESMFDVLEAVHG